MSEFEDLDGECCYKGIDLIPLVQYMQGMAKHAKGRRGVVRRRVGFLIIDFVREAVCAFYSLVAFLHILLVGRQYEHVYVSSMNNQCSVNGQLIDRVVDPFIREMKGADKALKLSFSRFYRRGKRAYAYDFNVTYVIYFISIYFYILGRVKHDAKIKKLYESFNTNKNPLEFSEKKFLKALCILDSGVFIFSLLMRHTQPTALYVSNPYSLETLAAIYVANYLEISSYCIQHGFQNRAHFAFRFEKNYNTLPRKYLVWDALSKGSIEKFSSVEIVGFKWSEYVLENADFSFLKSLIGGRIGAVLITTQPSTGIITDEIVRLISRCQNYFFLYRLHPSQNNNDSLRILEEKFNSLENVEFNYSTAAPLPLLLQFSSFHITGFSSCVIEAVNQGCKTFVYHPKALDYYGDLLEGGGIEYITLSDFGCFLGGSNE